MSRRIRERHEGGYASGDWFVNQLPPYSFPHSGPAYSEYSRLEDYVGNKGLWNPCYHFKYKGHSGEEWVCYNGSTVHMRYTGSPAYVAIRPEMVEACMPGPPLSILATCGRNALIQATTQIPSNTSIANFLIELKDGVKGVVPEIKKLKDCLGNAYLGYKFGTDSFVRDLKSIYGSWGSTMRRLAFLKRHNGHEHWVRAFRDQKHGNAFGAESVSVPGIQTTFEWSDDPEHKPAVAHRLVELRPVPDSLRGEVHVNVLSYFLLEGLETFWGKVDAMGAALGLNNPAKIAWNAIPFTWLLEYFVKVGPLLDRLSSQPFKGSMEVRAAWSSYKYKMLVEVWCGTAGTCQLKPGPGMKLHVGDLLVEIYSRVPGVYLSEEDMVGINLTNQQVGILLALAESRLSWDQTKWTAWAARKWGPWANGGKPRLRFKQPPAWWRNFFRRKTRRLR